MKQRNTYVTLQHSPYEGVQFAVYTVYRNILAVYTNGNKRGIMVHEERRETFRSSAILCRNHITTNKRSVSNPGGC